MSAIFDANSPYSSQQPYEPYPSSSSSQAPNLQFYSQSSGGAGSGYNDGYASGSGGRPSLEGNMASASGTSYGPGGTAGSMMGAKMGFWSAFGTGGFPDEPSLMEELGINLPHILDKSLTVLNPLHRYSAAHPKDAHMMDDADLAGPLLFCFAFGMLLLLSGKSQFGYIYGVALLGDVSIYMLLNMMSEGGIDAYRVASVLGYCLLPLCLLSAASVVHRLDGWLGYLISPLFILWCASSASGIFVSILRMSDQRLLVAYPLGLFYACFALLSVFEVGGSGAVPKTKS